MAKKNSNNKKPISLAARMLAPVRDYFNVTVGDPFHDISDVYHNTAPNRAPQEKFIRNISTSVIDMARKQRAMVSADGPNRPATTAVGTSDQLNIANGAHCASR